MFDYIRPRKFNWIIVTHIYGHEQQDMKYTNRLIADLLKVFFELSGISA